MSDEHVSTRNNEDTVDSKKWLNYIDLLFSAIKSQLKRFWIYLEIKLKIIQVLSDINKNKEQ